MSFSRKIDSDNKLQAGETGSNCLSVNLDSTKAHCTIPLQWILTQFWPDISKLWYKQIWQNLSVIIFCSKTVFLINRKELMKCTKKCVKKFLTYPLPFRSKEISVFNQSVSADTTIWIIISQNLYISLLITLWSYLKLKVRNRLNIKSLFNSQLWQEESRLFVGQAASSSLFLHHICKFCGDTNNYHYLLLLSNICLC